MATYYVDASGGSDSNDGLTTGAPFLTLAKCVTVAAAGDTFNLKGTFYESADFTGKGNNITIQQWAGQTAAWIRGDTVVSGFVVDGGGQCYNKTVTASLYVATVTANWMTQVNNKGRHYGHLTRATTLANCKATNDSWYYDSGTGVLSVRIGANADPAGYTVTYVKVTQPTAGVNGITIGSSTGTAASGIRVLNLNFGMWCWPAAGFGYPLRLYSCQNSFAKGNVYHDSGYHALGLVNYNGAPMRNVKGIDESAYGIVASGDSIYVAYSGTGGIDVESGFENCYAYLEPFLGMDGNPIAFYNPVTLSQITSATALGIICHTDGGMNISKFRANNCLVIVGGVHSSMTNRMGSYRIANASAPSNKLNEKTYGAWLDRCDTLNGVASLFKDSAAWTDSIIHLGQSGTSGAARQTNGGVLGDNATITAEAWMLWKANDIRVDLDISSVAADASAVWQVRGNSTGSLKSHIILINNSVLNTSLSTAAQVRAFFNHIVTYSSDIYARGNIFMHRAAASGANHNNLTWNNGAVTPALIDFKDNWYINIDTDRYTSGSTYNDKTEFDDIDTTGVYDGDTNPFRDNSGNSILELNYYGKSRTAFVIPNCGDGINRRAYSKQYGAYQYGIPATTTKPL